MSNVEYRHHVENHREIQTSKKEIVRVAKSLIASDNENAAKSVVNLYCFLVGASAETRLKKLLAEPNIKVQNLAEKIDCNASQIDQWLDVVTQAFRIRYNVPNAPITSSNIGPVPFARFDSVRDLLNLDLRDIIELRNKIAHGQWKYPFTSDGLKVDSKKYHALDSVNLMSLILKDGLINMLGDAIDLLAQNEIAFDRDFDRLFVRIEQARRRLRTQKYETFKRNLKKRSRPNWPPNDVLQTG